MTLKAMIHLQINMLSTFVGEFCYLSSVESSSLGLPRIVANHFWKEKSHKC